MGGVLAAAEIDGVLAAVEIDGVLAAVEIDGVLAAAEIDGVLGEGFIAEIQHRDSIRVGVTTGIPERTTDAFELDDGAILISMADGGMRSRGGLRGRLTTMKRPFMAAAANIGMIAALQAGVIAIPITTVA